MAVKNNQAGLYQNLEDSFRFLKIADDDENIDIGHGRIETRKCTIITDMAHIEYPDKWEKLNVLIRIESKRCDKATGVTENSTRYYIASKRESASFYQKNIRNHWGIENNLHWTLDVVFQEDACRKRDGNTAQNFSLINKVAINILKNDQSKNISSRRKRNIASWDMEYLAKLLNF